MARPATGVPSPGDHQLPHPEATEQVSMMQLVRMAMQRHTAMFMSQMVGELTQTQFATMARLLETGPCSHNHLGRLVFLDAATINGVISRLQGRGFITIRSDRKDTRLRIISLSRKGRHMTSAAIVVAMKVNAETLHALTTEEQNTLTALLKKLGSAGLSAAQSHAPVSPAQGRQDETSRMALVNIRTNNPQKETPARAISSRRLSSL